MLKSPVSVLQEYTVKKNLPFPYYHYQVLEEISNIPTFECSVAVGNNKASAIGSTKKEAKHNAASKVLENFNITMNFDPSNKSSNVETSNICLLPTVTSNINMSPKINFIGKLNEFCAGKYPHPTYSDGHNILGPYFIIECRFQEYKTEGQGQTKKEAKQDAARQMMQLVKNMSLSNVVLPIQSIQYVNLSNFEEVVDKYSQMMSNMAISDSDKNNNNNISNGNGMCSGKSKSIVSTWEELLELIKKQGWHHQLNHFQSNPLMLRLKINYYTLIEVGCTPDEICGKFATTVGQMIDEGIDFGSSMKIGNS
ncbi:RISC-loading complex subunit tarbp2-like [Euwallacea fornicatus]|uniref:RISC-loading complex subunit tarbp2-like n=1 Tax=Euwallacea fornicatus TaxID=995702 RepID=UPI00338FFC01